MMAAMTPEDLLNWDEDNSRKRKARTNRQLNTTSVTLNRARETVCWQSSHGYFGDPSTLDVFDANARDSDCHTDYN